MYQEMAHTQPFETYNSKGEIRQCNQGRLKFTMDSYSQPGLIVVTFELPRHLSTALIDVDVHPNYLRVTVKGKVTQLRLPEDISPDNTQKGEFMARKSPKATSAAVVLNDNCIADPNETIQRAQ
ncbi:leucine rich repeat protein, putative [Eimeria praecox]|uniref:Leucine rich repeat protein, putative n=1 Tax=Eimeria praecox TaxID=51316 RepID=U6H3T5_9EIME|nr:leucine rich repeat protein, putative [Eimeria praecox]